MSAWAAATRRSGRSASSQRPQGDRLSGRLMPFSARSFEPCADAVSIRRGSRQGRRSRRRRSACRRRARRAGLVLRRRMPPTTYSRYVASRLAVSPWFGRLQRLRQSQAVADAQQMVLGNWREDPTVVDVAVATKNGARLDVGRVPGQRGRLTSGRMEQRGVAGASPSYRRVRPRPPVRVAPTMQGLDRKGGRRLAVIVGAPTSMTCAGATATPRRSR